MSSRQNQLSKRRSSSVPSMTSSRVSILVQSIVADRLLVVSICVSYQAMRNLPDLADALIPMVARAGSVILRIYDGAFTVQPTDDDSPLTLADLESQRIIIEGLAQLTPDIPVLSEESAQAPWPEPRSWQ